MATLVRPWIVEYRTRDGKRVPKGTPGAKKHRYRSAKWYGQGLPGQPPKKRFPLATDKAAARRMLDDLVRGAERGQVQIPDADAGRVRLADHLAAFERDVALGLAARGRGRRKRVPSPGQVRLTVQRVRDVLDGCGLRSPADLNDDAPARVAAYLQGRVGKPRADGGVSHQTAAFILAAARRFVWWLSARKRLPVRPDLLDDVPGFEPDGNRVHARRAVSTAELARLLDATRASTRAARTLTGEDRYHLYLTAFSTGYRAGELAALAPENFDLDADAPTVLLTGRRTKNRKAAAIPLPPGVAAQLRGYLKGKPAGKPVWPGGWPRHAARMLRADLEAAGVPYAVEGPHGTEYADFHALRTSFVSALAAAGAGPKELQELARHGDPRLTLGVYTKARPEQLAAAVNRLAIPGAGAAANPFAHLTRDQLELALGVAVGLLRWCFGTAGASGGANGGDGGTDRDGGQPLADAA